MNLAQKLLMLHEGGLVKLPTGLQVKVTGGAKTIVMGQVLSAVNQVISKFSVLLKNLDKKHQNYKDIQNIIKMLERYVKTYKMYKPRKSNVRNKKIVIEPKDMLPYKVDNPFTILLTTNTSYRGGTKGHIKTNKGQTDFHDEIPLGINFSSIGGTIDVFKSVANNATNLALMMKDNKPLSDNSMKTLSVTFPEFKTFVKDIQKELSDAISILRHELTHVIQIQTGQGYNHKDFNKEGGYIQLKGKSQGAFDRYSVGSKEIKAYLVNQVDRFYNNGLKGKTYSEAIAKFVDDTLWFKAFKDSEKRKAVIRDFVLAVEKDRRYRNLIKG